jgi:hypothetical protein
MSSVATDNLVMFPNSPVRTDSPMTDEAEVEKSFCLIRPDDWVINRKMKKIILLEFKRTTNLRESYFQDMWNVWDNVRSRKRSGRKPSGSLGLGKRMGKGSSTDPSINGQLRYPNDIDRFKKETVTDKIRRYRVDSNNNPHNVVSFIPPITGTSGEYIVNLCVFYYKLIGKPPHDVLLTVQIQDWEHSHKDYSTPDYFE